MPSTLRPGLILLTLSSLLHILGPPIADFNETHVLNPNWPPHARFHNGQTMTMGACLGLLILYYTWRPPPPSLSTSSKTFPSPSSSTSSSSSMRANYEAKAGDIWTAALIASLYYFSALTAVLYPGSAGVDPEFRERYTSDFPQFWPFVGILVMTWVGWGLERFGVGVAGAGVERGGKIKEV